MEGDIYNVMLVWSSAVISLCYCYGIGKITSKGITRLFCMIPVVFLFLYLPIKIQSVQFGAITSFFLAWLANFKLLLFGFGKGPLSSDISLPLFLALACLPIKIQHQEGETSNVSDKNKENPSHKSHQINSKGHKSLTNYAIKGIIWVVLVCVHDYSQHYLHPKLMLCLYCFYIYFFLEIAFAIFAASARALLGLELEPQFDEPYLSASLQDFWGRRWNLMVTSILRPTVYFPVRNFCAGLIGRKWAPLLAVMGTFVVSAVMHEIVFYHFGRLWPTGEIALFFLLHGVCLTVEIALKKALEGTTGSWRLPRPIASVLTVGFVLVTAFWLFFPPLNRCSTVERALEELAAIGSFFNDGVRFSYTVRSYNDRTTSKDL